jgi:glycerol-3-phosphate dehydrogenase
VGLKLNVKHERLAYANYMSVLGDSTDIVNRNTDRSRRRENQEYVSVSLPECRTKSGYEIRKQII